MCKLNFKNEVFFSNFNIYLGNFVYLPSSVYEGNSYFPGAGQSFLFNSFLELVPNLGNLNYTL
jgi:hypothetical protein